MKRLFFSVIFIISGFFPFWLNAQKQGTDERYNVLKNPSVHYDNRVDNMLYWNYALRNRYVDSYPVEKENPKVRYVGSMITSPFFVLQDSPDIPIWESGVTQSENSVTTHPSDYEKLLNSNNSTDYPVNGLFGSNWSMSDDAGESWEGEKYGAGGDNSGDPAVAINSQGRLFVGFINENFGQSVSFSDDNGQNWTKILVAPAPGYYPATLDKNHLWLDNSATSPFLGNLYAAWTRFSAGGTYDGEIQISRSVTNGTSWSNPLVISPGITAGSHNQGVNIQTGPEGEVYLVWAVYDSWPGDESALGFAASFDGGLTFQPAQRIMNNIRGIRYSQTTKNLRVNSFPSMAVDLSNGPRRGTIYVVWANYGFPGVNTGNDIDVYLIKSTDLGNTWSQPVRVNQDLPGLGKQHFFPWISCDPITGNLSVIFYDDRDCSIEECETWIAYSSDGGETWLDFRVSDVAFTPQPIAGLAANYFGDYLGITSNNMKIYPVWTDNRSGKALSYTSPINSTPTPNQPYVVYQSHVFRNNGGSSVDFLTFGDSLTIDLTAINIGDQPASLVNVLLSSSSPFIQITDSTHYYGDFAPMQAVYVNKAFACQISDTVPDNEKIKFIVRAADSNNLWISHFYAKASAPDLRIKKLLINDYTGNGNQIPDAGESAYLCFILANEGDFVCDTIKCFFSADPMWVTQLDSLKIVEPLYPGQSDTVRFFVTFSDTLPYGTTLFFALRCQSGKYIRHKTFQSRSALKVEDWESGGFNKYPWKSTGNSPWVITTAAFEGKFAAKSGLIPDGGSTILSITYDIIHPDSVSFWYRISSESNYDFFSFFVDNILYGKWSGIREWRKVAFKVPAGRHTLRWQYEKDIFQAMGEDAVWLDYITLPIFALPIADAGENLAICNNLDSVYLEGRAENFSQTNWSTLGDGSFKDSLATATWYYPGEGEKFAGKATLILKASNEMALSSDTLLIFIQKPPSPPHSVFAIPDRICQESMTEIILKAQTVDSGTIIYWFKDDCIEANIIDSGFSVKVFAPEETSLYYARSKNACGFSKCIETTVTVNPLPSLYLGPDSIYCSGETVVLDGGDFKYHLWSNGYTHRYLIVDTPMIQTGMVQMLHITVKDSIGCRGSDTIFIGFKKCVPGIIDSEQLSFRVYPNPNNGNFILSWKGSILSSFEIELTDLSGKNFFRNVYFVSFSLQSVKVNPKPPPGNYLLRIKARGNQWVLPVCIIGE